MTTLAEDVLDGLTRPFKELPPKHLYDETLADEYPELEVVPVVGDFEQDLDRIPPPSGPRLIAFPGGTIGNFLPGARRAFLRALAGALGPGDRLLLGAQLITRGC